MKRSFTVLLAGAALFGLFSCKKTASKPQNCNLVALTDSTTSVQSVTQFSYDDNNRISSIVVTGQKACTRTLQYIGNTVIFSVTDTTAGIRVEQDTLTMFNNNLVQTLNTHYPTSGDNIVETYAYDATGTVTSSYEIANGVPGDTVEYTTVNGDLMYDNYKDEAEHRDDFSYYPSQGIVFGDPTYFRQLVYEGSYYYINKHMLSALSQPGVSYKAYTYSFTNNRIDKQTLKYWTPATDTVVHTVSYSYSCK